jgi:hypothetical protein
MLRRSQVGRTVGDVAARVGGSRHRTTPGTVLEARRRLMTGAIAPTRPLSALDLCDRCGAPAYVRVLLPGSGELLFCAHHNRKHAEALAKIAVEIQDETGRLTSKPSDAAS